MFPAIVAWDCLPPEPRCQAAAVVPRGPAAVVTRGPAAVVTRGPAAVVTCGPAGHRQQGTGSGSL